jgi:hypothetical protein
MRSLFGGIPIKDARLLGAKPLLATLLTLGASVLAVTLYLRWRMPDFTLPLAGQVSAIKISALVDESNDRYVPEFEVPTIYWDAILGALCPYAPDQEPRKWQGLCMLTITKHDGQRTVVNVFTSFDKDFVPFYVAPSGLSDHRYYRGGSEKKLREVIHRIRLTHSK